MRRDALMVSMAIALIPGIILGSAAGVVEASPSQHSSSTITVDSRTIPVTLRIQMDHRAMIEAECLIPAPPAVVWRVLSDYDHLSEIVPFLTESRVIGQRDGAKFLHQAGRGGLWIFQRRFTVTFQVNERPESSITFKAIDGDFLTFEGFWRIEAQPDGTRVSHQVTV